MKRAMIEVQFNWIFIILVGAIILVFFAGVTVWYKENEEKKIASDVMNKLRAAMTGASVSSRTASELEIPNAGFAFMCDAGECSSYGCLSSFEFIGTGISKDTTMDVLFTQHVIESDFLHTWTQEWQVPFKVANFVYFSSPRVSLYLVHDGGASQEFAENTASVLRKNVNARFAVISSGDVPRVPYKNEEMVRFMYFFSPGGVTYSEDMRKSGRASHVVISGTSESGTVTFGEQVPKSYPYIGMASLLGALFSADSEIYICNMKKAMLRLALVSEVYRQRTVMLHADNPNHARCDPFYDSQVQGYFTSIKNAAANPDSPDTNAIMAAVSKLENVNRQTVLNTCPRLY